MSAVARRAKAEGVIRRYVWQNGGLRFAPIRPKHWDVLDEDISIAGLLAGHGDVTRSEGRALPR